MDVLATTGLSLEDDVLRFERERDAWSLPVRDLRLLGEYTTPSGPIDDDYFLVFIDRSGNRYEAPVDHAATAAVRRLRERLGPFDFGLASSTALQSRIMWPPEYADKPLYVFTRQPATTLGDKVRRLFGSYGVDTALTPAARAALGQHVTAADEFDDGGHRMLVADADRRVIELVLQAMHQREWAVETARTKEDTFEKISKKTYDLLLVDLQTNGIDVLQYLRRWYRPSRVVLMSREHTLDPTAVGLADDILYKPFNKKKLRERLRRYAEEADTKTG